MSCAIAGVSSTTKISKSDIEGYKLLSNLYAKNKEYKLAYENSITYQTLKDSINLTTQYKTESSLIIPEPIKTTSEDNNSTSIDEENYSFGQLTTILSVALITILSLLTLSLYKNNNIRLKTNNMLFKKNKELLTEKEKAEIAAKTKSNFLSTVTHELRTPLYAVTGLTNMLLEENPKPDQIPHLKSLKFSGDYLLTFINDILQINKIAPGSQEIVYDCWLPFTNNFLANGYVLHNSIEQDADLVLMIYRDQYYSNDNNNGITDIIIAKHRNGPVGTVNLLFDSDTASFGSIIN